MDMPFKSASEITAMAASCFPLARAAATGIDQDVLDLVAPKPEQEAKKLAAIADNIDPLIQQIAADQSLGAARADLAALLRCTTAYLRGQPVPSIPARYAQQWAEWTGVN